MAPRKRKAAVPSNAPGRVRRSRAKEAPEIPKVEKLISKVSKGKSPKQKKANISVAKDVENSQELKTDAKTLEEIIETSTTIVIEHCKQCNSFKTRAIQVKDGLEKAVPGVTVMLNPEKPRRGCFEIRAEGGETFISLLDMKRPFQPMKALHMEEVIADIAKKIQ